MTQRGSQTGETYETYSSISRTKLKYAVALAKMRRPYLDGEGGDRNQFDVAFKQKNTIEFIDLHAT